MEKKGFFSAKEITGLAVLLALVIVLQSLSAVFPLFVQLNLALIPIVLAAVLYGTLAGGFLGLACGIVVLAQVISGGSPFYQLIWANDPIVTTLTCLVKTTAAGLLAGVAYRAIEKKNSLVALFAASGIVPIVNTALFIVGCLFMTDSVYQMANGQNVLVFILVGLVTWNFFIEFATNLLASPALHRVIGVVEKTFNKRKKK